MLYAGFMPSRIDFLIWIVFYVVLFTVAILANFGGDVNCAATGC